MYHIMEIETKSFKNGNILFVDVNIIDLENFKFERKIIAEIIANRIKNYAYKISIFNLLPIQSESQNDIRFYGSGSKNWKKFLNARFKSAPDLNTVKRFFELNKYDTVVLNSMYIDENKNTEYIGLVYYPKDGKILNWNESNKFRELYNKISKNVRKKF